MIKIIKSAKRSLCKTTIYIELTDGLRCRHIEIAKLSMCPKFLKLTGSRYIDRFCIKKRLLTSYLTFDWNDINLTNTLNGGQIKLKDKIKLGPIESWYVGNILKVRYCAYIVYTHMGTATYQTVATVCENKENLCDYN